MSITSIGLAVIAFLVAIKILKSLVSKAVVFGMFCCIAYYILTTYNVIGFMH